MADNVVQQQSLELKKNDVGTNLEMIVNNISKTDTVHLNCESCNKSTEIEWKCDQCRQYICDTCKEAHALFPVTSGHSVCSSDVAINGVKDDIQETIENINQRKTLVTAKIEEVKILSEKLNSIETKAIEEINEKHEKLLAVINNEYSQNLNVVKEAVKGKRIVVESLEESLNSCLKQECEAIVENLSKLKDSGELSNFVTYAKTMNLDMKRKPTEIQTKISSIKAVPLPDIIVSSPNANEKWSSTTVLISTSQNVKPNDCTSIHHSSDKMKESNGVPRSRVVRKSGKLTFALQNKEHCLPNQNTFNFSSANRTALQSDFKFGDIQPGFQFSKDNKGNPKFFWNKPEIDFSTLCSKNTKFINSKIIELPNNSPVKNIHISGEHLWVTGTNAVYVFDSDLHLGKSITNHWELDGLVSAFPDQTGNIIACVGKNGLLYLDKNGWYKCDIIDEFCYDAVLANGYLYALSSSKIYFLKYEDSSWKCEPNASIPYNISNVDESNFSVGKSDLMYISHNTYISQLLYSVSGDQKVQSKITALQQQQQQMYGQQQQRAHSGSKSTSISYEQNKLGKKGGGKLGKLRKARLCGIDEAENVLVTDWENNRIQICNKDNDWAENLLVTDWENNRIQICNKDNDWAVLRLQIETPSTCVFDHVNNWLYVGTKTGNIVKYYVSVR